MAKNIVLQGDLAFIPVEGVESALRLRAYVNILDTRNLTVAKGEKTGHAHTIEQEVGVAAPNEVEGLLGWPIRNGQRLMVIVTAETPVEVKHEEHETAVLEPLTTYDVVRQVEYVAPPSRPGARTGDSRLSRFVSD